MAIDTRLDIKLSQNLVMTPQLQMAIKLLQMPMTELNDFIDQEMLENPFLQKDDGTSEEENLAPSSRSEGVENTAIDSSERLNSENMSDDNESLALDYEWESMYESPTMGNSASGGSFNGDDEFSWEQTASRDLTLRDHLTQQLGEATSDPVLIFLGNYIIDAIDDAGYFYSTVQDAAKRLHVSEDRFEDALRLIQSFEPAGVGARSLAECLKLQLEAEDALSSEMVVVLENLELLARREYGKLAKMAGVSGEEMHTLCQRITQLTPKPGLKYGSDVAAAVVPDVVIRKQEGAWVAELNAEAMPRVLVNGGFSVTKSEDKGFVSERMNRAQWLVKSLEQRARTIYKVANAILERQKDFFEYGAEYLQPMTLKDIAEIVEVHESTVSRVTNGKFMQTPTGVFELKYFFSSAIGTTGGNTTVASESVKQMLKRLIQDEDARKPLSDEKLVSLLKREGIDVARRTVAKYREAMNIPSTSGRRIRL